MTSRLIVSLLVASVFVVTISGAVNRKLSVLPQKCVSCQDCVRVCPREAIAIQHGKAVVDPEKCVGCKLCAQVCSYKAIRYIEEGE